MQALFNLPNEQAANRFAGVLVEALIAPLVLGFQGDLGTGKTTLIRAMLRNLGVTGAIKSPTFAWVESYFLAHFVVHHFDLYRLSDDTTFDMLGFRDYFSSDAICCIEWPERDPSLATLIDLSFSLEICGNGRKLLVSALSKPGERVLSHLQRMQV